MIYNDYDEWPTLNIQRIAGAYLYATNGKLVCYIKPDGTREWSPGMETESVASWESFGVYDPLQQKQLEDSVADIITSLSRKSQL